MTTSLDFVANYQKQDAFDAYLRENLSCFDYLEGYYNFDDNLQHVILYFTQPLNQNRIEMIDNLVANYVDPDTFFLFQYSEAFPCFGETIINDNDSTTFTPMSTCFVVNRQDNCVVNEMRIVIVSSPCPYDTDYESTNDPAVALKVDNINDGTEVGSSGEVLVEGDTLSDGSTLFEIVLQGLNFTPTDIENTWEISGYVLGNISARTVGVKMYRYVVE